MLLASLFGVVMGLILGLTGAGGGILAVPALVLGLGWTMTQAAPVALFAVGSAAAVGAIDGLRHGLVRYRAALLIAALGAVFSPVGIYFAHQLPEKVLMILFSLLMVMVAWPWSLGPSCWRSRRSMRHATITISRLNRIIRTFSGN